MTSSPPPRERRWIALVPAALSLAVFAQTGNFDFIAYDDNLYVYLNEEVSRGLSLEGLRWAFTTTLGGGWHPLAWLSHMADVSLFGLDPGWHHRVNVLFHAANGTLLYLFLRRATGAPWRSVLAASLFAVHPLHVESVAWVAERRDVLSALFFFLALHAYASYCARPALPGYLATLLLLCLGLLAKPMLVTFPFVLLAVDLWPLGRLLPGGRDGEGGAAVPLRRLLLEKAPFLVPAAAVALATVLVHTGKRASTVSLAARLANVPVSVVAYLERTAWPAGLSFFHPHPAYLQGDERLTLGKAAWSLALVAAATLLAVRWRHRRPWLLAGWSWFLVMLLPVLGFVPIGSLGSADRFTYLPLVGVFACFAWGAGEGAERLRLPPPARVAAASLLLAALSAAAWIQASTWRDTASVARRALAVREGNWMACNILSIRAAEERRPADAAEFYRKALAVRPKGEGRLWGSPSPSGPDLPGSGAPGEEGGPAPAKDGFMGQGMHLVRMGMEEEALARYREAVRLRPDDPLPRINLGALLLRAGDREGAVRELREATRLSPGNPDGHNNLSVALLEAGRREEAEEEARAAVRLRPAFADGHFNLARALEAQGRDREAAGAYREVLRLSPGDAMAQGSLDRLLARGGAR